MTVSRTVHVLAAMIPVFSISNTFKPIRKLLYDWTREECVDIRLTNIQQAIHMDSKHVNVDKLIMTGI